MNVWTELQELLLILLRWAIIHCPVIFKYTPMINYIGPLFNTEILCWSVSFNSIYSEKRKSKMKMISTILHYGDVIMGTMPSQITSLTIVYSTVYSSADQRKHQSSASLAFVGGIHRGPVNSPHKWPVTQKMFPFDDVIMPRNNL